MFRKLRSGGEQRGIAAPTAAGEPSLDVRPRPAPWFLRRRFLRPFTPVAALAVVGLVTLLVSTNLLLPFQRLVTLEGAVASTGDFFNDEQVRGLLLRHNIRVHTTYQGSREVATGDLRLLDFAFPSGQPAGEVIIQRRRASNLMHNSPYKPFISPIVLATYREYAETLHGAGVATPQSVSGVGRPYFYNLDMGGFVDLIGTGKSWNDLTSGAHRVTNGNEVLAQTTNVCASNSADTYLGLVSYVTHRGVSPTARGVPITDEEAVKFADDIKPVLRDQGLSMTNPLGVYLAPEGPQIAPIIVVYEHQYLAYQLSHRERFGELDSDRVLLYPNPLFETQPEFIAFNEDADRLGQLLTTDPDLRRRALELGFRVITPGVADSSEQLSGFLAAQGVPVPFPSSDTKAVLPEVPLLERMISVVGQCGR